MNSETNIEQQINETARNVNTLPGVDIPQDKDDVFKAAPTGEEASKIKKKVATEQENMKPKQFTLFDFSGLNGPFKNLKFIRDLQELSDYVLYSVEAPIVSNHFKIINHVLDPENKRPCIGIAYEVLPYKPFPNIDPTVTIPLAKANMSNPSYMVPLDFIAEKVNEYLQIKRVKEFSQTLVTNLTLLVSKWLGEGARDNRASAANTAANSVNMMPVDIDTNLGLLDTFHVGCWLYRRYQAPAVNNPNLYIINIKDYIAYRNTTQPTNLPADTSLLRLATLNNNDALLGKLCVFKDDGGDCVIIDYDNSVTTGQQNYHGIAAKVVPYATVNPCDDDLGLVLDRSLDKQTIQMALFLDLYHLPMHNVQFFAPDIDWRLPLYKVPTQEALVRIFANKDNEPLRFLSSPTHGGIDNYKIFYSFRIFKTMIAQEIAKSYGVITGIGRSQTIGEDNLIFNIYNEICPGWSCDTYISDDNADFTDQVLGFSPTYIPYEMFIQNMKTSNVKIELDSCDPMTGVEGNEVNMNFKFPRATLIDNYPQDERDDINHKLVTWFGLGNQLVNGQWLARSFIIGINLWYQMAVPDTLPLIGYGKKRVSAIVSDRDRLMYRKNNPYRGNRLLTPVTNF